MRLTNEVARKNEEEETSKDLPDCDFGIGDVPHIRDDERGDDVDDRQPRGRNLFLNTRSFFKRDGL